MKAFLPYLSAAALVFVAGWFSSFWYQQSGVDAMPNLQGPTIQTDQSPSIIGLEIPIRSKDGRGGDAVLKATFADQINEREIRVYGGFEYRTGDKVITGEEAVIHLVTGTARQMKGIKIWEK
mgnify:CR=1 FL=1